MLMLQSGQKIMFKQSPGAGGMVQMANGQPVRIVPLQHAAAGGSGPVTVQTASPQAAMAALRAPGGQGVQQGVVRQPQQQLHYRPVSQQPPQQQSVRHPHQQQQHWQQQQQQQPQQHPQQQQTGSEIQYNVEHVFEEDGREVRKMPIKVNGETLWVDCVPQSTSAEEAAGGGIMLDLDDKTLVNTNEAVPPPPPQPQGQQQPQQVAHQGAQPGQQMHQQQQPQQQQQLQQPRPAGPRR